MNKDKQIINIKKTFDKGKNRNILLDLSYEVEKNTDLNGKVKILDRCFNRITYNADISNMVSIIKTIFEDVKEEKIRIVLSKNEKIDELVMYYNNRLSKYVSNEVFDNKEELLFSYNYNNGVDIKLTNKNKRLFDYTANDLSSKITNRMFKVENLVKGDLKINLRRDDRYLVKLYEVMYDKKLDFNNPNMENIFISSLYLASENGVLMPDFIYFFKNSADKNGNILANRISDDNVSGLLLFDSIDTSDIRLSKDTMELLKELGSVLKGKEDKVVKIANTIYDDKYRRDFRNSYYNTDLVNKIKILIKE